MSNYTTLLGAEEVERAGRNIEGAAETMTRAANTMDAAADRIERAMQPPPDAVSDAPAPTLRDYFIVHAPVQPQPWFEPIGLPPRPTPESPAIENPDGLWTSWVQQQGQWQLLYERERWVQWPAAWADAMLKAREVRHG